jgi:hypothetical protein
MESEQRSFNRRRNGAFKPQADYDDVVLGLNSGGVNNYYRVYPQRRVSPDRNCLGTFYAEGLVKSYYT